MARKKKNAESDFAEKNNNPVSDPAPEAITESDDAVLLEIESHEVPESSDSKESGKIGEAFKKVAGTIGLWDDDSTIAPPKKDGRGRPKKTDPAEEFNTLVIALLTLGLSFANMPQEIKPNDSEISIFSKHLTGIMLRHLPISGKMSADALDIIGLIAVSSAWYARVKPYMAQVDKVKQIQPSASQPASQQRKPDPEKIPDRITQINPGVGDWLNRVHQTTGGGIQ